MRQGSPLLEVENVATAFQTPRGLLWAVEGVTFQVKRGETLGIVGESGCGKSALARSIMDLLPGSARTTGIVRFDGKDVRGLSKKEHLHFWGPEIALVLQDPMTSLNPVKRIGRQIMDPLRYHLGLSADAARRRAIELLDLVQIPDSARRLRQYPHELSGGMRQRVGIAIAVSCSPKLLIADEPTTALDVTVQKQILQLLGTLRKELDMAMILITHDLGVIARQAHRILVMYAGQVVEETDTLSMFAHTRHPYTEALIRSIPRISDPAHTRLEPIPGRPPDLVHPPKGCRYAPRCRYREAACDEEVPGLGGEKDHKYACFFPVGRLATRPKADPGLSPAAAGSGTDASSMTA